jgi:AcrR family transcriptional regulator
MSGTTRIRLSADQRRERLLAAAATEFGANGYRDASLRRIAAAAEITTPVIYDHFQSKAELYSALAWQLADDLLAHWVRAVSDSPEDALRAAIDAIFGWAETNPSGWRILFADAPSDPAVASTLTAILDRACKAVAAAISARAAGDSFGALDSMRASEAFARMTMSAVNGLVAWWWHNPDVPREVVSKLAGDLLWRGLPGVGQPNPDGQSAR